MKAFEEFKGKDSTFWAFIKFISENLGYSKKNTINQYSFEEINTLCGKLGMYADDVLIEEASKYSYCRADILNNYVHNNLMSGEEAQEEFRPLQQLHRLSHYRCKLPMNKQKGEMRQIAYFTAIINILAEKTIREITGKDERGFNDDPKCLLYILNENNEVIGASSRRFDGAYPETMNPKLVWEIKEYYYNKSFGSRVADGVYETQLDGHEFQEVYERTGRKVYHVLFIDSYNTWWNLGKSYLCRIVDAVNSGIVDEVIIGREVFTRWPELLREIV